MIRLVFLVGLAVFALLVAQLGCRRNQPAPRVVDVEAPGEVACPPQAVEADLVFANATVIDVAAGRAKPGMTVAVKGDRITAVLPAAEIAVPPTTRVIDGTGKYLIPGLWDMHAHVIQRSFLDWFLRYGVTGVRHMFAANPLYLYAKPTKPGGPPHPRMVLAHAILDGPDTVFTWPLSRNVVIAGDAKAARAGVREIKARGNDFLKVYSSLSRDAYFAAVEEAKAQGLAVAGHVPRSVTVGEASDAGQLTVEHLDGVAVQCSTMEARYNAQLRGKDGFGKGFDAATGWRIYVEAHETFDLSKADALFKKFVANGTWHVPTLTQTKQMARLADPAAIPTDVEHQLPEILSLLWKRKVTPEGVSVPNFSIQLSRKDLADREALCRGDTALVRKMHAAGVRILAGTDASAPLVVPGLALHDEVALLVDAGLTPADALRAATIGPAQCLKMEDQLGTIEAGKLADLVLLTKNPLDEIQHTRAIEVVMVGGQIVPR